MGIAGRREGLKSNVSGFIKVFCGGARGVMVIVVENGHGGTSSNPGRH